MAHTYFNIHPVHQGRLQIWQCHGINLGEGSSQVKAEAVQIDSQFCPPITESGNKLG